MTRARRAREPGPELRTLLGAPSGPPGREKARPFVGESGALPPPVEIARRHVEDARAAAEGITSRDVAAGLSHLAGSLLSGLPA